MPFAILLIVKIEFFIEIWRFKQMADGNGSGAGSAMWAVVTLLIVVIVVGALFFGGVLRNNGGTKKIDVDIQAPSAPSSR